MLGRLDQPTEFVNHRADHSHRHRDAGTLSATTDSDCETISRNAPLVWSRRVAHRCIPTIRRRCGSVLEAQTLAERAQRQLARGETGGIAAARSTRKSSLDAATMSAGAQGSPQAAINRLSK